MFDTVSQLAPVMGKLTMYSWFTIFLIYFGCACFTGYVCGKLAEIGGMSVNGYVFLGSFSTTVGLTVAFFKGVNPYLGLLTGLIGITITVIIFLTSRDKVKPIDMPQSPYYSPFETPIGYDDSHLNQLSAPNQPSQEEFAEGSIMCPKCYVSVPLNDPICWNCGELLRRQNIRRLCPTCHKEMPADAQVCDSCGSALDGPAFFKG